MTEDLKKLVLKLAVELGRPPTKYDIKDCDYLPSANTLQRKGVYLSGLWIQEYLYNLDQKSCINCDIQIDFEKSENNFCSKSCSATFNNLLKGKVKECKSCEILFKGSRASEFCSKVCYLKSYYIDRFLSWYYSEKNFGNRAIRDFLSTQFGYKCSFCGISEWNNIPITLEVEHIDGNSEDSSPSNVCLICPNCHSQTSTYKGKNKGNGRHFRKLRYAEGKSY